MKRCLLPSENAEAKCALLWMLGEYGELIPEAPYMMEAVIDAIKVRPG
jgi:hypothetical protein